MRLVKTLSQNLGQILPESFYRIYFVKKLFFTKKNRYGLKP
jgi:hypothetical protein